MEKVCMVIPNWNGWEDTIECLNSVYKLQGIENLVVVVVDNASTNQSIGKINEWALENIGSNEFMFLKEGTSFNGKLEEKTFFLLEKNANNGFAGAVNAGIKFGLQFPQIQSYWILNNDTIVDDRALVEVMKFERENEGKYSIIGNTILEYNKPEMIQCAGGCYYNPLLTVNKAYLKGEHISCVYHNQTVEKSFSYIHGASLFIPAKTIKEIGVLNEDYFLYYEELDFVQRCNRLGLKLGWCRTSLVYHKGGSSAGSKSAMNKSKSNLSEYYSNLSALKYTYKYHRRIFPIVASIRFSLKSFMFLKQGNWRLFKILCQSYNDFRLRKNGSYHT